MATLSSGDTLSLNNLATATDQSTKSMGTIAGSVATPISMSAFAIDEVGNLSGFTYVVENTSEDYVLNFTGSGGRFTKISEQKKNFDWSVSGGSYFSSASYSQAGAGSGSITLSAGDMVNSGALIGATSHTLSVTFADGFNDHATNYNSARTKTVYSVDSYDGNAASLCLVSDSPIEKADGTMVEIGDLSEGDELKGFSLAGLSETSDSNYLEWSTDNLGETQKNVKVVNITYSFSNKIYNINNGEVKGTHEHPMLVKDSADGMYRFKRLISIELGDKLIRAVDGSLTEVEVTSIVLENEDVEIVSMDVEVQDTYLVNGYLTHNKGSDSHTDLAAPGAPSSITYNSGAGTISWTAPSSVGTTGITAYDWTLSPNSDYSSPVDNGDETEWSATSINLAGQSISLVGGQTYYFRVRAIDQGLAGTYGTLSFNYVD
tara:strand:+ start:20852 stop:22150 length:1299 start_codon:yes stop_codon:yes gene_type:complete